MIFWKQFSNIVRSCVPSQYSGSIINTKALDSLPLNPINPQTTVEHLKGSSVEPQAKEDPEQDPKRLEDKEPTPPNENKAATPPEENQEPPNENKEPAPPKENKERTPTEVATQTENPPAVTVPKNIRQAKKKKKSSQISPRKAFLTVPFKYRLEVERELFYYDSNEEKEYTTRLTFHGHTKTEATVYLPVSIFHKETVSLNYHLGKITIKDNVVWALRRFSEDSEGKHLLAESTKKMCEESYSHCSSYTFFTRSKLARGKCLLIESEIFSGGQLFSSFVLRIYST